MTPKLSIGQKNRVSVKNITNFGVFVNIGDDVGFIHISNLSWGIVNDPNDIVALKQKIKVKILNIDPETNRIEVGLKQLTQNPWDQYEIKYAVGTIHHNKIHEMNIKGATIKLEENFIALIQKSDLKKSDGSILKEEEYANFKVIKFSKEFKKIIVVISQ
jgi:small subunit ribosomal protein S1